MSRTKSRRGFFGTSWIALILIVLLSVGVTCGLLKLTDNFSLGISDLLQNEDNLIRSIEEYTTKSGNTGEGLTWTVKDDKSIVLDGKISSEASQLEFVLGEVVIQEDGEYTLSGVEDASLTTCYIVGTYTDADGNTKSIIGDIASSCTAELTEGTSVTFKIVAFANVDFDNVIIKPTFVLGDEIGRF